LIIKKRALNKKIEKMQTNGTHLIKINAKYTVSGI
jgi:hypothetical protein